MTAKEEYLLIQRVEGEAEVRRLSAALQNAQKDFDNARRTYASGSAALETHRRHVAFLSNQLSQAESKIKSFSSEMKGMGRTALQAGRVFDDLQYVGQNGQGLRPIINNITEFNPLLGVALIGIDLLIRHIDKFQGLISQGATLTEADRMAQLAENTHKTVDEQKEFNKLKREQQEIEELRERRTKEENEVERQVKDVIGEEKNNGLSGEELLVKGLSDVADKDHSHNRSGLTPDEFAVLDEVDRKIEIYEALIQRASTLRQDDPNYNEARKSIRFFEGQIEREKRRGRSLYDFGEDNSSYNYIMSKLQKKKVEEAEKLILGATKDPKQLETMIKRIEANPGAFPPGLAERLREATPEGRKEFLASDEWADEQIKSMEKSGKAASRGIREAKRERIRKEEAEDDEWAHAQISDMQKSGDAAKRGLQKARQKQKKEEDDWEKKQIKSTQDSGEAAHKGIVRAHKQNVRDLNEEKIGVYAPFLEDQTKSQLINREMSGQNPLEAMKAVQKQVASVLQQIEPLLKPEEAQKKAEEFVQKRQSDIFDDLKKGPSKGEKRNSETIDIASFASKIQAGVSGNDYEKQMADSIKSILQIMSGFKGAGTPRFG